MKYIFCTTAVAAIPSIAGMDFVPLPIAPSVAAVPIEESLPKTLAVSLRPKRHAPRPTVAAFAEFTRRFFAPWYLRIEDIPELDDLSDADQERVEALGAEPAEGTIEVVPGRNYLIDAKLESSAGVVVVHSKPDGAHVSLDGKDQWVVQGNTTGGVVTSYDLTTKSNIKYHFTNPNGTSWLCATISDLNGNTLTIARSFG